MLVTAFKITTKTTDSLRQTMNQMGNKVMVKLPNVMVEQGHGETKPCYYPRELPNVMVEQGLKRCNFKLVVADASMPLVLMSHNRVCKKKREWNRGLDRIQYAYDEPE
ncbi:hypothetical protein F2Q70_00043517 [Brassica cretica]|uniref:Uncharacterized protein n=1 Tax=Brassica cretica TaxID=69181 RepID=A0A8S9KK16_BRACR|nr:hypothetical protein F2Q70_00043517 [Brassica cretica]